MSQGAILPRRGPLWGAAMYNALNTKFLAGGTLAFTDTNGTAYTVLFAELTYESATTQEDAFLSVKVVFHVVSSP